MGLISNKYQMSSECKVIFNGPILSWRELAVLYNNDPILQRANDIFDPNNALSFGRNNLSGYMTGLQLQKIYLAGRDFYVGRSGT